MGGTGSNIDDQENLGWFGTRDKQAIRCNTETCDQCVILQEAKERTFAISWLITIWNFINARDAQCIEQCFHPIIKITAVPNQRSWWCRSKEKDFKIGEEVDLQVLAFLISGGGIG